MPNVNLSLVVRSSLTTGFSLVGGLLLAVVLGEFVFSALPGHSIDNPSLALILLSALPAIAGMLAGAAVWGLVMGRLAGATDMRRMALAGAMGFAPVTALCGIGLGVLEPIAVGWLGARLPIHRLFTVLFVPN